MFNIIMKFKFYNINNILDKVGFSKNQAKHIDDNINFFLPSFV